MATELQLTGGALPFKINGKEFNARTLHDLDYAELDGYVQFRFLEDTRDRLRELSLTPEEKQEWLTSTIKAANTVSWNSAEGSRIFREIEGLARLGWQMIKDQNGITYDQFLKEIKCGNDTITSETFHRVKEHADEIQRVYIKLNVTSSNGDEESKEDSSEKPKSN